MDTGAIHKLITDGLRVQSSLRWGTFWDHPGFRSPARITITDTTSGEVFEVSVRKVISGCGNPERCGALGVCICERAPKRSDRPVRTRTP